MDPFRSTQDDWLKSWSPAIDDDDNNLIENISSSPLWSLSDELFYGTTLPPPIVSPLQTVDYQTPNTATISTILDVAPLQTVDGETHTTTTAPPPLEVAPLRTVDDNTTTTPSTLEVTPLQTANEEAHNTTIPPPTLDVPLLQTVDGETHNTPTPPSTLELTLPQTVTDEACSTTPPPIMASPLQAIIPLDDANKDSSADAGPSTDPIKRKRGRPKGSKNLKVTPLQTANEEAHNTTTPPPTLDAPLLQTVNGETHNTPTPPSTLEVTLAQTVTDEAYSTTPPPIMVSPLQAIIPLDDANKDSSADAGPSTDPIKRKRGRPKGSKNLKGTTKKPKAYDPNSKVVISCAGFDSGISEAERETGNQEIADSVLMRFDAVRRRLCQLKCVKGLLTTAFTNCQNLGVRTNTKKRIGPVPGVQVGDIFYFWGEMCLVGLHTQMVAGIAYMTEKDGASEGPLATSVVTSGHYNDEREDLHTLIYTGHGGVDKNGQAVDQKLGRGNLALEASRKQGNEVRVIRGEEDPMNMKKKIYVYDGLYVVSNCWKEKGSTGFEEFKFKLVRKPDQPSGYANWKSTRSWINCGLDSSRKGLILQDLSDGAETLPVPLVNEIDENDQERPHDFSYNSSSTSSSMETVQNYQPTTCSNCQGQLCECQNCPCIQKNNGELPYHKRVLVCRKPMVYECGSMCPCLPDCHNRITQTGLKIRVEVFKTETCGWGLRSWEPIRAGTFICELVGVAKRRDEVEEDDEYVFDTSRVYNQFRWNYEPELVGEDCWDQVSEAYKLPWQVLISSKTHGNVSRFMNHSCSPNVMWQPIEFEDTHQPSLCIAFFAMKHIPPLTELRYDYGMSCTSEEVGEDGKKIFWGKKVCHCGSVKCRGSFG